MTSEMESATLYAYQNSTMSPPEAVSAEKEPDPRTGRHYHVVVKGSVKGSTGRAGLGIVRQLKDGDAVLRQGADGGCAKEASSTHIRADMLAALRAVLSCREQDVPVVVVTTSEYLCKGMTESLPRWKENGWVGSDGFVKNADLWQQLDAACAERQVFWQHVKAKESELTPSGRQAKALAAEALQGFYPKGWVSVKAVHPGLFFERPDNAA